MPPFSKDRHKISPALLILSVLTAAFLILPYCYPPIFDHMNTIITAFYIPNKNSISLQYILGLPLYLGIYALWALTVTVYIVVPGLKKLPCKQRAYKNILFTPSLLFFAAILTLQTLSQFCFHLTEIKILTGQSTEQIIKQRAPRSFAFARYCQQQFPGKHKGLAITDLDMENPSQLLTYLTTAYYLYPIDIRVDRDAPPDCLIIFAKEDPQSAVTPGFVALTPFDHSSLIAVKQP